MSYHMFLFVYVCFIFKRSGQSGVPIPDTIEPSTPKFYSFACDMRYADMPNNVDNFAARSDRQIPRPALLISRWPSGHTFSTTLPVAPAEQRHLLTAADSLKFAQYSLTPTSTCHQTLQQMPPVHRPSLHAGGGATVLGTRQIQKMIWEAVASYSH